MQNKFSYPVIFLLTVALSACSLYFDENDIPEEQLGVGQEAVVKDSVSTVTYEYQPGVRKLTTATLQYLVMAEGDSVLYFMETTPDDLMPQKGVVISSGRSELLPIGVNGRVSDVAVVNGMKRCTVVRLSLDEVFKTLRFEYHGPADWQNAQTIDEHGNVVPQARTTRAEIEKSIDKMNWKFAIRSDGAGVSSAEYIYNNEAKPIDLPESLKGIMGKAKFDAELGAVNEETVHASFDMAKYNVECYIEEETTISAKMSVEKGYSDRKTTLSKNNEGKKLQILDSPVAIDVTYGIDSEIEFDLAAKQTVEAEVKSHRRLGFKYVSKKFSLINENLTTTQDIFKKLDVEGSANTAVKARAKVGLNIAGYAEGTVGGTLKTGLETMLQHSQYGDSLQLNDRNYIRLYLNAGFDTDVKVMLKGAVVYDYKKTLADTTLLSKKWPLFPSLLDMTITPRDITDTKVSFDGQFTVNDGLLARLGAQIKPFLRVYSGDKYTDYSPAEGNNKVLPDKTSVFNFSISNLDKSSTYEVVPGLIYAGNRYIYDRKEFAQPATPSDAGIVLQNYKQLYGDKALDASSAFDHEYICNIDAKLTGGSKFKSWGVTVKMINSKGKTIAANNYDVDKQKTGTYTLRFTLFASSAPPCRLVMQPYAVTQDGEEKRFREYEYVLLNPAPNLLGDAKEADVDFGSS